jgi:hypothetical protein
MWPLTLLVLSLFAPAQFYVDIGSFRLSAYRIALFIVLPFLTTRLWRWRGGFHIYDAAIFILAPWMIFAMSINHGLGQGLESGGIIAFETVIGYLAARLYLTDRAAIVAFIRFLTVCLMAASCILILEIVAGRRLVAEIAASLTGHSIEYAEKSRRFGLERAGGPFAHPIHAGVFASVMLTFAWLTMGGLVQRLFRTGLLFSGTFATLSSAPLLGALLQLGLVAYHWICARAGIRKPWTLFFLGIAALVIFLELASNRGAVKVLVNLTALDPLTGYYRILIWTFGSEVVANNPIFGIGQHDWARPGWMVNSSVDAFWLLVAMTYGLPAVALLAYASIAIFRRLIVIQRTTSMEDSRYLLATLITLFMLIFVGFTVHYWGSVYILYLLFLGLGASLAAGALDERKSSLRQHRNMKQNVSFRPTRPISPPDSR